MYWIGSQHRKYNLKTDYWYTIDIVPDKYYYKYFNKEHCTSAYRRILNDDTICGSPDMEWVKRNT